MIAVELRLQAGSAFPSGGYTATARLRAGSSSGTALGEATALVPGPLAAGTQRLVRLDFAGIALTPGATYLIEWVTPPTTVLTWVGTNTNPYAAGSAFSCSGNAWPGGMTDFNFITYAEEAQLTCEDMLERLAGDVEDLPLGPLARDRLGRLLDLAAQELGRGKPYGAHALVLAFEWQLRYMMRFGMLAEALGEPLLEDAAELRACLRECGVPTRWCTQADAALQRSRPHLH